MLFRQTGNTADSKNFNLKNLIICILKNIEYPGELPDRK